MTVDPSIWEGAVLWAAPVTGNVEEALAQMPAKGIGIPITETTVLQDDDVPGTSQR